MADRRQDQDTETRGNGNGDARFTSAAEENKSLPNLVEDAIGHASGLMREEVRLARAEVMDGLRSMQGGAISVGIAVAILLPAITLLLYAAAFGMAAAGWVPAWAGAAIVGAIAAVIGAILLMTGKSKMDPSQLSAPKAAAEAGRTARFAKEQAR